MDHNCTFYMDTTEPPVRAIVSVCPSGLAVEVESKDGTGTISYPGVPSYLLDIDDQNMVLVEQTYYVFTGKRGPEISHKASEWQWRNPELKCACGSFDYRPLGHAAFTCNDCDRRFFEEGEKAE